MTEAATLTPAAHGYWTERARRHGARAAINLDHPPGALPAVSVDHCDRLMPLLARRLTGTERLVLDLGCGPGRLTAALARTAACRAVGADPVPAMLALAPPSEAVSYALVRDGRLPALDASVDVVFTCLVLGGILDAAALAATAAEVERVLAPGGLVLLAESVSDRRSDAHWTARPAAAYQHAFAFARLEEVDAFDDGGDPIAVLAGRVA